VLCLLGTTILPADAGRGNSRSHDQRLLAWVLDCTHSIAIKVVNPGGISAFKFNQRSLDVDEEARLLTAHSAPGCCTRSHGPCRLGVPTAARARLHLGVPGNRRYDAGRSGRPRLAIHLTLSSSQLWHRGDRKFSSAAAASPSDQRSKERRRQIMSARP